MNYSNAYNVLENFKERNKPVEPEIHDQCTNDEQKFDPNGTQRSRTMTQTSGRSQQVGFTKKEP